MGNTNGVNLAETEVPQLKQLLEIDGYLKVSLATNFLFSLICKQISWFEKKIYSPTSPRSVADTDASNSIWKR
jgi:hypothetical protein